jgi:hypothetical protein
MLRTITKARSARAVIVVALATTMLSGLGTVSRSQAVSMSEGSTG